MTTAIGAIALVAAIWIFLYCLERTLAWRVDLYGRTSRVPHSGPREEHRFSFLFAVQNSEPIPLLGPLRIAVTIDMSGVAFGEPPSFACGPRHKVSRAYKQLTSDDKTVLAIECQELPPLDTWTIKFVCSAHPSAVRFSVAPLEANQGSRPQRSRVFPLLSMRELRLALDEESQPLPKTPSWWLGASVTSLLAILYVFPFVSRDWSWLPLRECFTPWSWIDWIILGGLIVLSLGVFMVSRRPPVPIIQGYLDPHKFEELGRVELGHAATSP